jgi:DNA-binding HxlR family transcriptional regulator
VDPTIPSVADAFGIDGSAPYEVQQTVHRYLSQEMRHNILQVILGHPSHLVSTTEFPYYVPRSRSAISDQLADLTYHEIITKYHHEPNTGPHEFWGLTEFGIDLLHEYKYLRGLPILRAVHDTTRKPRRCNATRTHRTHPSRLRFTTHSTTTNQ